jgi:hypothetical protein
METGHLNPSSQRTYEQVFQHPMSHDLEWRNLRTMFGELGEVDEEHNGNLKVTLGGHSFVFQPASDSDVASAEEIRKIRNLLRGSEDLEGNSFGAHLLLVMNHSEARIYRTEMEGAIPEMITPYNPEGRLIHVHSSHDYGGPSEQPEMDAYFRDIAKSLKRAEKILIFGSGTGSSAAMTLFADWLRRNRKDISANVIAAVTIDQGHMTEGQLLAKAREIYADV